MISQEEKQEMIPLSLKLALGGLALVGVHMVLAQAYFWIRREDYFFGFLVPLFVIYVIYERWGALQGLLAGRGHPDWEKEEAPVVGGSPVRWPDYFLNALAWAGLLGGGLIFLVGAFVVGTMGASGAGTFFITGGFCAMALSTIFLSTPTGIENPRLLRSEGIFSLIQWNTRLQVTLLFVFPVLIWMISAPLVDALERQVSLFLLNKVTVVVFFVFDMTLHPLEQQGNVLILPTGMVGVADACSGIRSLTACLFAGSFLAAVFLNSIWRKIALVATAMLFAFLTNILRSLVLTGVAYYQGPEAIEGTIHDVTGYAVLVLTSIGLIVLLPVFNFDLQKPLKEKADGKGDDE